MDDYTKITHKRYSDTNYNNDDNKKIKYFRNLITRILLSFILAISICIFVKLKENNVFLVKKYIFEDSLEFTKLNNWYQDNFGKLIPQNKENTNLVFSSGDILKNEYTSYENGVKITTSKSNPISLLNGGIVVFIGEKDNYGNTIIVQGNDGIDYWYGNITNVSISLYDYLEKDTLIGEANDDFIYLVLQKDGQFMNYEEYLA